MAAEFSGAMPRLYGAPAYTRPPSHDAGTQRPFDPDDLPLECYRGAAEMDEPHGFGGVDPLAFGPEPSTTEAEDWLHRAIRSPFGLARR